MWKNYLKIAYRTLWKNKVFSVINIVGLAKLLATNLRLSDGNPLVVIGSSYSTGWAIVHAYCRSSNDKNPIGKSCATAV